MSNVHSSFVHFPSLLIVTWCRHCQIAWWPNHYPLHWPDHWFTYWYANWPLARHPMHSVFANSRNLPIIIIISTLVLVVPHKLPPPHHHHHRLWLCVSDWLTDCLCHITTTTRTTDGQEESSSVDCVDCCMRKLHKMYFFIFSITTQLIYLSIHHQKKHERRHQWIIMPFDRGGIVRSFAQGWIIAVQNMKSESGKKWRLWIWFCGARRYDAIRYWSGWRLMGGQCGVGGGTWLSPINEFLYSLLDYIMYYATANEWRNEWATDHWMVQH